MPTFGLSAYFFEVKMKQYKFSELYTNGSDCVIVLGCFDGIHKAHQKLIKDAFDISEINRLPLVVWALNVVRGNKLMEAEEKVAMLGRLGADAVITEELDDIKNNSCEEFVKTLVEVYGAKHIVCGYNFTFGQYKSGNCDTLKELALKYAAEVTVVPEVSIDGVTVSSTAVRNALTGGNPALAGTLLGRFYEISGIVEHGAERGKDFGFPTANLPIMDGMVIPRFGVYRTFVEHCGKRYLAVTNIGVCPSVKVGDNKITVESYIIGKNLDLYGERIGVKLASFIRPEKKFKSVEDLQAAIAEDVKWAKREFESK